MDYGRGTPLLPNESTEEAFPVDSDRAEGWSYGFPFLLVLAYLLVDYGRPQDWFTPLRLVRPGMIIIAANVLVLFTRGALVVPRLAKYMLAFLSLMVLLIPVARNSRMAFNTTWSFALLMFGAVLPIISCTDTYRRFERLIGFFVWIHVPLALYSLTHRGFGIGSFLSDENDFCLALNVVLPYAVALFVLSRSAVRRVLLGLVVALILVAATSTFSRGGFVGLLSVAVMIWLRSRRKILMLVVAAALAGVVFASTPSSYWLEMKTIETADRKGDTGNTRLYYWSLAWQMFLDHPVVGVGPNNFQFNTLSYDAPLRGLGVWGRAAHSVYFTLLPEFGVPGVVLFAAIAIGGWRVRRRLRKRCATFLAGLEGSEDDRQRTRTLREILGAIDASLVAFLSTAAFISVLYYPHFWILTALTAAAAIVGEKLVPDPQLAEEPVVANWQVAGQVRPGSGQEIRPRAQ